MSETKEILLGSKVKCKVTGFKGTAYSRVTYLNGCVRIEVQPDVNKKGEHQSSYYIDEDQLIVTAQPPKKPVAKKTAKKKTTGGPMSSSPRL